MSATSLSFLLATRNAHKTREFAEILGPGFAITDLTEAEDIPAIDETGSTLEENAALKGLAISRLLSGLVVADDSGLEVAALDGAPGIYSARYAGVNATDAANVRRLLAELRGKESRAARFRCALVVARAGETIATVGGEIAGVITQAPRGGNGFGYDPIFVPQGFDKTFAQLGASLKNHMSHRAKAIEALRAVFREIMTENRPADSADR